MNKPTLTTSKSVFVPRGTATYTPKWSIVVLALACLGVLKFNGLHQKTDGERTSTASFFPIIETETMPNGRPPGGIARRNEASWLGAGAEGSNHVDSAAMDRLKNGK